MLTKQLRELESDGMVARKVYTQVPPKVVYSLTELRRTLEPVLFKLWEWGEDHIIPRIANEAEQADGPAGPDASTAR